MFLFGAVPTISISFHGSDRIQKQKKKVSVPGSEIQEEICIFEGQEAVAGSVEVALQPGKKLEHLGIKIEMIGQIELYYDRGNTMKFTSLVRELEVPGTLTETQVYPFEFNTEKPYETYSGINVRLRYLIRVVITRNYSPSITKDQDFIVQNLSQSGSEVTVGQPQLPVKMEVGIEECLHIEFEYDKNSYHLKDVINGRINFLLVRIKIKYMELAIVRREFAGSGVNVQNESESIIKFELMDGAPVKGEVVPIRLYLAPLDQLTPTHRSINNVFSVKYFLNLVLVDEEDRRYFKQQEVILWRREKS